MIIQELKVGPEKEKNGEIEGPGVKKDGGYVSFCDLREEKALVPILLRDFCPTPPT